MIYIATHNNSYHADDIFAVATLQLFLDSQSQEYHVIRTRDIEEIQKVDYVVDVGKEYDHEKKRYDHHQLDGAGQHENGIPYASFGLVWKHYGKDLCGGDIEVSDEINRKLVMPIDASDNGFDYMSVDADLKVSPYTIGQVFKVFSPTEDEEFTRDEVFLEMVGLAKNILRREILKTRIHIESVRYVQDEYEKQKANEPRAVVVENHVSRRHVNAALAQPENSEILYAIYPVQGATKEEGVWTLLSVREDMNTAKSRFPLPEEWRGLDGEEFEKATGVKDVIFCHRSGFMAQANSYDSAIALLKIALEKAGK